MVWCNYEWAWGGRYTHFYKEQSLNGCDILEHELQPIRFQGQFYDVETGLHYNRFRYYDSDVGMFISRDPIGLLGGNNVFQYADNPVMWIDPLGLKKKSSSRKPIFVKTKSTARTKTRNRNEKFAMDFAKKHPDRAKEIIKPNEIGDPCFKNKGWSKMSITVNGVEIHFMAKLDKNRKLLEVTDFKFKDPETPEQRRKKEERKKSILGNCV